MRVDAFEVAGLWEGAGVLEGYNDEVLGGMRLGRGRGSQFGRRAGLRIVEGAFGGRDENS